MAEQRGLMMVAAPTNSDNAPAESTLEGAEEGQPDENKPEPEAEPIYTVKVERRVE